MPSLLQLLPAAALLCGSVVAADSAKPCSAKSALSGIFYDLSGTAASRHGRSGPAGELPPSWPAAGHDYHSNFSLNFCEPVTETLAGVVGLPREEWGSVGAFYEQGESVYSIGQLNTEPIVRGRKLVLNYTDGSPCPEPGPNSAERQTPARQKSSIISFICDRNSLSSTVSLSFIGTVDECSYFFEARALSACGGVEYTREQIRPGDLFLMMFLIAFLAYFIGGCVYMRTVEHERGWRQIPHYDVWASICRGVLRALAQTLGLIIRCFPGGSRLIHAIQRRTSRPSERHISTWDSAQP